MDLKICSIAWFVLFFSIIGIIIDYYIFGTSLIGFLLNVIITIFFVWLANWACYKQGYNWIAWFIVIFFGFSFMGMIYIYKKKDTNLDIQQAIIEEKKIREKYKL
jgi:hypothetical protein